MTLDININKYIFYTRNQQGVPIQSIINTKTMQFYRLFTQAVCQPLFTRNYLRTSLIKKCILLKSLTLFKLSYLSIFINDYYITTIIR